MRPDYSGKVCVVTGGASGIGRALAVKLCAEGAHVAISDINEEGLAETIQHIAPRSNRIATDRLDVSDRAAVSAYPAKVKEVLGDADYVFNVAGLTRIGDFRETSIEAIEQVFDVNFWGVLLMTKAFLPQLEKTKGSVVNISSVFGLVGFPGQAHYCASKFAVRGFSETIAQELESLGVSVTSVHPGGVDTDIVRNASVDSVPDQFSSREQIVDTFANTARTSPDRAADIILAGAAKRKKRVIVGKDAAVISFFQRLFPQSYSRFISLVSDRQKQTTE